MTKQVSGFCGTSLNMKLWNYRDKDECPLCAESEDSCHVLRCNSIAAINKWDESIQALGATLVANHTPSETIKSSQDIYIYGRTQSA